jgi:hypothetical protein
MLNYICIILSSFEQVFSRTRTWAIFCVIIFSFFGCYEVIGVTSFCRFLGIGESGYNSLLHFFRSTAWTLDALVFHWTAFLISEKVIIKEQGRAILLGDHTNVAKDARKTPGVVTLHQTSETQTKPSYFRGHFWGGVGALTGSEEEPFCTPVELGIHQGGIHIGEEQSPDDKDTLGVKIVRMAQKFALEHNLPSFLVLDAFFSKCKNFCISKFYMVIRFKTAFTNTDCQGKKELCSIF